MIVIDLGAQAVIAGSMTVGGLADGRQPVRDDHDGPALHDPAHVVLHDPFAFIVQRARRLVEDQDARIRGEGAGDGDPLALTTRQIGTAWYLSTLSKGILGPCLDYGFYVPKSGVDPFMKKRGRNWTYCNLTKRNRIGVGHLLSPRGLRA